MIAPKGKNIPSSKLRHNDEKKKKDDGLWDDDGMITWLSVPTLTLLPFTTNSPRLGDMPSNAEAYLYIYIYICVCVYVCVCAFSA